MNPLFQLAQTINLDLKVMKFRPEAANFTSQYIAAAIAGTLILAAMVFALFFARRRRQLSELNQQREVARLRLMMAELNLGESEMQILAAIADSDRPSDLVPLLESRPDFEEALLLFRKANPEHPALKRVSQLRQRLEYGFSNIRNPFSDTRMLAPGTRMQCRIRLANRSINFLTTLLGINESNFIIRPPHAKGKPVTLSGLKDLYFRVSRENDAEYEFTCRVMGQLPGGNRAVMMEHTREISRMLFRHAERVETGIVLQLYVIRQESTSDRSLAHLKAIDSQFVFDGTILDLSIGGVLVSAKGRQDRLHDGDIVVFKLPGAQIKDDLVTQVVGLFSNEEGATQMHLQFLGMKELNRLKLSKYLDSLKENPLPSGLDADSSTPAAS